MTSRVPFLKATAAAVCLAGTVCNPLVNPLANTVANAQASAQARDEPALTTADYVAIQQLVNRLNFALDYCGNGGRDFADLFSDGGRFIIDEGDGQPNVIATRDGLIGLAGGPDCQSRQTPPSAHILHLAESLVIEASPEGARGMSYAIYPPSKGRRFAVDVDGQVGIYFDEYVRTPDGWRMATRHHVVNPAVGDVRMQALYEADGDD